MSFWSLCRHKEYFPTCQFCLFIPRLDNQAVISLLLSFRCPDLTGFCTDLQAQESLVCSSTAMLNVETSKEIQLQKTSVVLLAHSLLSLCLLSLWWVRGHSFYVAALLHFKPKHFFCREQEERWASGCCSCTNFSKVPPAYTRWETSSESKATDIMGTLGRLKFKLADCVHS